MSFLGGGTDLPSFYLEEEGATLATAINKYIYISLHDSFDQSHHLSYGKTEICETTGAIEHKIFRRVLAKYALQIAKKRKGRGLQITSTADVPYGTGLGSSGSFTVGLLSALGGHLGDMKRHDQLAREASDVEIEDLQEPIGRQDQYITAFGGLQYIRYLPTGQIVVEPVVCAMRTRAALESSILLFYTGMTRSASNILAELKSNTEVKRDSLREMKKLAQRLKMALENSAGIPQIGKLLHEGWALKKTFASGISAQKIDEWYLRACEAGAVGGKILGAGGGGFLMIMCEPEKKYRVLHELRELRNLPVSLEAGGTQVIFNETSGQCRSNYPNKNFTEL